MAGRTSQVEKDLEAQGLVAGGAAADEGDSPITSATYRPKPPAQLGDEAAHVWYRLVNARPADWFPPETHDMLASYCQHVVTLDRLQQLIDVIEQKSASLDVKAYGELLSQRRGEVNSLAMLATRMRLSQQSRYSARRGEDGGVVTPAEQEGDGEEPPKPWE